jgi:hypothetical protein
MGRRLVVARKVRSVDVEGGRADPGLVEEEKLTTLTKNTGRCSWTDAGRAGDKGWLELFVAMADATDGLGCAVGVTRVERVGGGRHASRQPQSRQPLTVTIDIDTASCLRYHADGGCSSMHH